MVSEVKEFSLADFFAILRSAWRLILVLSFAGLAAGVALSLVLRPVYRAEVLLAPAATEDGGNSAISRIADQFGPLSGLVGLDGGGGFASTEVRVATMRSRRLTEEFFRQNDLIPKLYSGLWDEANGQWMVEEGESMDPGVGAAYRLFDEEVRFIEEDASTGLITLAIEWHDRQFVAEWCNALVRLANEYMRTRAIEEANRSVAFLENELENTSVVERRQIIYRLIESRVNEIMMANGRQEYAFVVVDPAVEPEADDFIRPRRALLGFTGLVAGGLLAFFLGAILWARKASPITST